VSAQTIYWVDGIRAEALPLPDRALEFGDGLFETYLYAENRFFYLEQHLRRLSKGLKRLEFPDCLERVQRQVAQIQQELTDANIQQAAVRLTVSRGSGPRGYAPPETACPRIVINATVGDSDWRKRLPPARLGLAQIRCASQPALAGIKHLNRLEQVLAAQERLDAGCDEMLMADFNDEVVSVISGNLFAVIKGSLVTPALGSSGVEGTRRQLLLEQWAPALGIEANTGELTLDSIRQADELFFTNALVGLRSVASFESLHWEKHPVCDALYKLYAGDNS